MSRFAYLQVFNETGKEVYFQKLEPWEQNWELNLSKLTQGMYIYSISTSERVVTSGKLVKLN